MGIISLVTLTKGREEGAARETPTCEVMLGEQSFGGQASVWLRGSSLFRGLGGFAPFGEPGVELGGLSFICSFADRHHQSLSQLTPSRHIPSPDLVVALFPPSNSTFFFLFG